MFGKMKLLGAICIYGLVASAQSAVCIVHDVGANDKSHCVCSTPTGLIDVSSLGNPNKVAR